MRVIALVLICLAGTCDGLSTDMAVGENDPAKAFASLLLANNPPAAVSIPGGVPKVNGKLKSPLEFEALGQTFTVPVEFDGREVTTGLETNVNGVKLALPLSFLIDKLDALGPDSLDLEKIKAELEAPVEFDVSGVPISVPVDYEAGKVNHPLNFKTQGLEVEVPLSSSIQGGLSGYELDDILSQTKVTAETPLEFDVGGMPLSIPLSFQDGKISSDLELKVKGTTLTLPVSFLLRSLADLRPGDLDLNKVKAELESPVEFDASGLPVTVPVSYEDGNVKFPLKVDANGWEFEVPLSYNVN